MRIHTCGEERAPVVIMLPGSFCNADTMMNIIMELEAEFHILAVDYNGQYAGSEMPFTSRRGEAEEIIRYLREHAISSVALVYGQSMGGEMGIRQYLKGYSNRTIWNIFWSANNYAVPKAAPKLDTRIQFWVGTDEWGSRTRDLKWTKRYLPQIEVVKIPNMMHGEFVMMHPEAFAEKALAFLASADRQRSAQA